MEKEMERQSQRCWGRNREGEQADMQDLLILQEMLGSL